MRWQGIELGAEERPEKLIARASGLERGSRAV